MMKAKDNLVQLEAYFRIKNSIGQRMTPERIGPLEELSSYKIPC